MKRLMIYLVCGAISAALVTLALRNVLPLLPIVVIVAVVGALLGELVKKLVK